MFLPQNATHSCCCRVIPKGGTDTLRIAFAMGSSSFRLRCRPSVWPLMSPLFSPLTSDICPLRPAAVAKDLDTFFTKRAVLRQVHRCSAVTCPQMQKETIAAIQHLLWTRFLSVATEAYFVLVLGLACPANPGFCLSPVCALSVCVPSLLCFVFDLCSPHQCLFSWDCYVLFLCLSWACARPPTQVSSCLGCALVRIGGRVARDSP